MTMRARRALAVVGFIGASSCGRPPADPSSPGSPPPPPTVAEAGVTVLLDGKATNTVGYCNLGLMLTTQVTNRSSRPLRVSNLQMDYTAEPGWGCSKHTAPIEGRSDVLVEPERTETVRVFDAAGTLCLPPAGGTDCRWTARARVETDQGEATGSLQVTTTSPQFAPGMPAPVISHPPDGAVVSGTVRVSATVVEDCGCVIRARTYVWLFGDSDGALFRSGPHDLDPWHWDTTRFPNGSYVLRASQNCCAVLGDPVRVTVRN